MKSCLRGDLLMITMDDIIREGHPTLRAVAKEVPIPPTAEDVELGKEMLPIIDALAEFGSYYKSVVG